MDHRREESLQQTCEIAVTSRTPLWILEVQDPNGSRRFPLVKSRTVLGTSRRADIPVKDTTVSGFHCAFEPVGARIRVTDLGSKNGTFAGNAVFIFGGRFIADKLDANHQILNWAIGGIFAVTAIIMLWRILMKKDASVNL